MHRHLRHNSNLTHSHFFNDVNHYNTEYYHQDDANIKQTSKGDGKKTIRNMNDGQIKLVTIKEVSAKDFERHVLNSNKVSGFDFASQRARSLKI